MLSSITGRQMRAAIIVAWVVAALATPVSAAEPATRYLALGDSLAWGDGASVPTETAYVPLLADYFAGTPHGGAKRHVNLGTRGETTATFVLNQLGPAMAAIGDPSTDVRMITLSVGGNDLLDLLNEPTDPCVADPTSLTCQILVGTAMADVAARYPVILGGLTTALSGDPGGARIYVLTLYNPFGGTGHPLEAAVDVGLLGSDMRINCETYPTAAGLNDIIACTSLAFGATVVDSYPVFGDNALALTHIGEGFNIHPNDHGYALIAKAHRKAG